MSKSKPSAGDIFDAALQLPPGQRNAHVQAACDGDDALRQRVLALLAAHEAAGSFMEDPAPPARPDAPVDPTSDETRPSGTLRLATEPVGEVIGQTIGRYKLRQKIGEGGCGVVYVAEQTEPVRRKVAIKVIKLGMDTRQVIARFEAERQALAMMDHPNIAKVLDGGTTESGRPYFVMELVRGIRITDYCDQNHLGTQDRLALFTLVCQAIQHAHQKGIIHRDIKPSNILVTPHDGVPVPKVIDFGIAKAIEGRLTDSTVFTQLHQFMGTPAYMSPEQAEMSGLDIDTRSDIYSLGVLLYELLAGTTPFDAKQLVAAGVDAMRTMIREQEPVRPSARLGTMVGTTSTTIAQHRSTDAVKLAHQIRGDLDWIVMKCLEKDRTRRYETANGLAMDIKRHLDDEPVLARPPSAAYLLRKTCRRHRLAFTAGTAVALALFVGIGISTWQAIRATSFSESARQANVAEREQRLAAQAERDKAQVAERRAEEALAKEAAEHQRAEDALARVELEKSEVSFATQDSSAALAHLARAGRRSPSNKVAAARLFSALTQRRFNGRLTDALEHADEVCSAQFSPDGLRVVTASEDGTARVWDAQTGQAFAEPLKQEVPVRNAQSGSGGQRVMTASADKLASNVAAPRLPLPIPDWVLKLTEAIANQRFDEEDLPHPVPVLELLALKRQLSEVPTSDPWTRLGRWYFQDPATRTLSPLSTVTVPEYVQQRIQEGTVESLREAVRLAPVNGLALACLGVAVLNQPSANHPLQAGEAAWYCPWREPDLTSGDSCRLPASATKPVISRTESPGFP